jgi:hypothetical protein
MPLFHGENEYLSNPPPSDASEEDLAFYESEWAKLKEQCPHSIEFTDNIYNNNEYGEIPIWVDVCIQDEGVLPFKMAKGLLTSYDGAEAILFSKFYDFSINKFRVSHSRMHVTKYGASLEIFGKDNEQVEVDITPQFNKAIGE